MSERSARERARDLVAAIAALPARAPEDEPAAVFRPVERTVFRPVEPERTGEAEGPDAPTT